MKRTRSVARAEALAKSFYTNLPSEMRAEIRLAHREHPFEHVFRVTLQRVCKLFYRDDPGLILVRQIEPFAHILRPLQSPELQTFLGYVFAFGLHLQRDFKRVVNVRLPQPATDELMTDLHETSKDLRFAVALEFSSYDTYDIPTAILATKQPTDTTIDEPRPFVYYGKGGRAIRHNRGTQILRAPDKGSLLWSRVVRPAARLSYSTRHSWYIGEIVRLLAYELDDIAEKSGSGFQNDSEDESAYLF